MAKSQGALILITLLIGALFFLAGLVFTLQGEGIVGPTSSFMFQSTAWITNGLIVLIVGVVLIGLGLYFQRRSKTRSRVQETVQNPTEDQKSKPDA